MSGPRVVIIGAGAGGLASAIDLAAAGCRVTVCDKAQRAGGKMRQLDVAGQGIDAGPTVFTMRWIFESLFRDAGACFETALDFQPADILARHWWTGGGQLDLHHSVEQSRAAILDFAGQDAAQGFQRLCADGADIFNTMRTTFMAAQKPSPLGLTLRAGWRGLPGLLRSRPQQNLWRALGQYFKDPRLQQLFGRYATYVGSSPLLTPATLMLIAHVEQTEVCLLPGGMLSLAKAMEALAEEHDAQFRYGAGVDRIEVTSGRISGVVLESGERLPADAIVFNGDFNALATGLLGDGVKRVAPKVKADQRGLSAVTWCARVKRTDFPLHYHNVFFDGNYPDEFESVFKRRQLPRRPTVYICAQDRMTGSTELEEERLLILVNAPADGDNRGRAAEWTHEQVWPQARAVLADAGFQLELSPENLTRTGPVEFNDLFPASGGSLYGRASHGMMSSFTRPGARTKVKGLYLAGGSVHPGPGVPMATLSGRLAASALLQDAGRRAVQSFI